MRVLHTADWHLGKALGGFSLLEDQAQVLAEVVDLVRRGDIAAVLLAGDVFDRAVPPTDAIRLFEWFLEEVTRGAGADVVAISGNHDSAERLGFGANLFAKERVHLRTRLADRASPVVVRRGGTSLAIHALPYVEPEEARLALKAEGDDAVTVPDHDTAVRRMLEAVHRAPPAAEHRALLAHLFCTGGFESPDSERPLAVGTAGHVSPSALDGFDYVALGHLHAPQSVGGREHIRYAGSPLKYSVREATQPKGVTFAAFGVGVEIESQPLHPRRDLVVLRGAFDALLSDPRHDAHRGHFVAAEYEDATFVLHAAERLRERFPFLLQAVPVRLRLGADAPRAFAPRPDTPRDLLAQFWEAAKLGVALEPAHVDAFERAHAAAGEEGDT